MKECLHCCSAFTKKPCFEKKNDPLGNKAEPGLDRLNLDNVLASRAHVMLAGGHDSGKVASYSKPYSWMNFTEVQSWSQSLNKSVSSLL